VAGHLSWDGKVHLSASQHLLVRFATARVSIQWDRSGHALETRLTAGSNTQDCAGLILIMARSCCGSGSKYTTQCYRIAGLSLPICQWKTGVYVCRWEAQANLGWSYCNALSQICSGTLSDSDISVDTHASRNTHIHVCRTIEWTIVPTERINQYGHGKWQKFNLCKSRRQQ